MTKYITHNGITFTPAQWFAFNRCISNAEQFSSSHQIVEATNLEKLDNKILFTLSKKAKPNTGMLFLVDKHWTVLIGRNGGVKSSDNAKHTRLSSNKYSTFI